MPPAYPFCFLIRSPLARFRQSLPKLRALGRLCFQLASRERALAGSKGHSSPGANFSNSVSKGGVEYLQFACFHKSREKQGL